MKDKKRPWTPAEIADLVKMWGQNLGVGPIALSLKRRPAVVRAKVSHLRSTQLELRELLVYRVACPGGKLKPKDIPKIRRDTRTLRLIGETYGVSAVTIFKVKRGETWRNA